MVVLRLNDEHSLWPWYAGATAVLEDPVKMTDFIAVEFFINLPGVISQWLELSAHDRQ